MSDTKKHKVPAKNFIGTIMANVDNDKLDDVDFRNFIRNTLPIVEKPEFDELGNAEVKERIKKYY